MRTGLLFGLNSGVITTLGLVVGLNAGTESRLAVLGGIIVIAVADALSDALGIHIAEESDAATDASHVWAATFATFVAKFVVAATFAVPVLLLSLDTAVVVAIVWGLLVVAGSSWWLARAQGNKPLHAVVEHVLIAAGVVAVSQGVGVWVQATFG